MNYRHAFHAGNFADVLKHAVLALVIEHLKLKEKPFLVLDTHAGVGSYRLDGPEAARTQEWQSGIGRLAGDEAGPIPDDVAGILAPYLDAVRSANPDGGLSCYPGSPALALALMRPADRLVASELHPDDAASLRAAIGADRRARVLGLDGWQALRANLPPKERRGVILIDPPFEAPGEYDRLVAALQQGVRRFAGGIYLLWFPIKDRQAVAGFEAALARQDFDKMLWVEFRLGNPDAIGPLRASGLAIVNPPFRLAAQLEVLLPFLASRLQAVDDAAGFASFALRRPGLLADVAGTTSAD